MAKKNNNYNRNSEVENRSRMVEETLNTNEMEVTEETNKVIEEVVSEENVVETQDMVDNKEEVHEEVVESSNEEEHVIEVHKETGEDVEEVEEIETIDPEEYKNDSYPKELDQNIEISAKYKLNSLASDMEEYVRKNPEYGSVRELREMLSQPEENIGVKLFTNARIVEEVTLMEKRDYYQIGGFEGEYLPREADLSMFKSPQKSLNLALDQVKMLIEKGYRLKNNRTGDIIKKRNVDEYIAKWSKDKNPIISNKVYY